LFREETVSTLLYAALTKQREWAPAHTSKGQGEPVTVAVGATTDEKNAAAAAGKPGVSSFVDAMAALVPAEVLLAHGLLIELGTSTKNGTDGKTVTTITHPEALKTFFVILLITSLGLYVIGHAGSWQGIDFLRMLFPPLAFAAWTMLQKATMFDPWAPGWSAITRLGTALVIALLVGASAKVLADRDDAAPPRV
jgi:hypothetical protein